MCLKKMNYNLSKLRIFFLKNDKAIEMQLLCNYFRLCYERYKVMQQNMEYYLVLNTSIFHL